MGVGVFPREMRVMIRRSGGGTADSQDREIILFYAVAIRPDRNDVILPFQPAHICGQVSFVNSRERDVAKVRGDPTTSAHDICSRWAAKQRFRAS